MVDKRTSSKASRPRHSQAGMTLIETAIALAILLIVASGLTSLGIVAMTTTENQGHLVTRTAEYAQDKMEQLMSLKYSDTYTDTIDPDCVNYLEGYNCSDPNLVTEEGLTPGGSIDLNSPVEHYVDYLNAAGDPLGGGATPPTDWFYMRVWMIEDAGNEAPGAPALPANMKRITVAVSTRTTVNQESGQQLKSVLTTLKSYPF